MGRACNMNVENWNAYRILVGKLEGKRSTLQRLDVDGRIILKCMLEM
jgi:hypothetical protein